MLLNFKAIALQYCEITRPHLFLGDAFFFNFDPQVNSISVVENIDDFDVEEALWLFYLLEQKFNDFIFAQKYFLFVFGDMSAGALYP